MKGCRKIRGSMAAWLYGDLNDQERVSLEQHLASCSMCRAEAEALKRVVSAVSRTEPVLDCDLVPVLRRRRAEERVPARPRVWAWSLASAACVAVLAVVAYVSFAPPGSGQALVAALHPRTEPAEIASPVQAALSEVSQLVERRDFTGAAQVLAKAVEAHPDDPNAGLAQQRLADIEFENLRWYAEADEAYKTLAARYPQVYSGRPESIWRRELLAEAREKDFEPLYQIDAAEQRRADAFPMLERVVSQYPGPFIASHAAEKMAQLVLQDTPAPVGENGHLFAMAQARGRCTDPVAIAQLTLEMGHICREELSDMARARNLYTETVNNEDTVLAQRQVAQDALQRLPQP